ncbi:MAG: hypothetical protein V2I33_23065 [Kangiellaceae bacterium]|nr:hypothetical protein [Kangiellaceae bacterium]
MKDGVGITPGLFMALFGGMRRYPTMLAEGVAKAMPGLIQTWGGTQIDPSIPPFVIAL